MNIWSIRIACGFLAIVGLTAGCSASPDENKVVLLTHESFALSEGTLEEFTQRTGIEVVLQISGDAGTMVNQAILTKDNPIADVLYGVDNTFLSRALDAGIFSPYTADGIEDVNPLLRVDGGAVTPIDFGDVCVNYDIEGLASLDTPPPQSLEDLVDRAYKDLLVVEDPATSSPGLAFLMATIAAYPDGAEYDWRSYWRDLFDNGAVVATDWSEAYYTRFTRSGGAQPLVVSYASSPAAEVFFGDLAEAPTGVMTSGCFKQIEYAGVLEGSQRESNARQLIDYLLSVPVQEDIPLNMFVYPANAKANLPQVFADHTTFPDAVVMEPGTIEANRERWIKEWTEIARS